MYIYMAFFVSTTLAFPIDTDTFSDYYEHDWFICSGLIIRLSLCKRAENDSAEYHDVS